MTRDELLDWLLLPWNIVKAIAMTAWWIVAALVRGGDDEVPVQPRPRRAARIPRPHRAPKGVNAQVASTNSPRS